MPLTSSAAVPSLAQQIPELSQATPRIGAANRLHLFISASLHRTWRTCFLDSELRLPFQLNQKYF